MGGGDCFIAGTKVLMSDGSEKNIEDIKIGDEVLTSDVDSLELMGKVVNGTMTQYHTGEGDDLTVKVVFSDGTWNQNTNSHPYYVIGKGWCSNRPDLSRIKYGLGNIDQLEVGDIVLSHKGEEGLVQVEVMGVENIHESVITYNLYNIQDNHNYFANTILVHNKGGDASSGGDMGMSGMPSGAVGNAPGGGGVGNSGDVAGGGLGGSVGGPGGDMGFADLGFAVDTSSIDSAPSVASAQAAVDASDSGGSFGFNTSLATTTLTATSLLGVPAPAALGLAGLAGVIGGSDFGSGNVGAPEGPGDYGGPDGSGRDDNPSLGDVGDFTPAPEPEPTTPGGGGDEADETPNLEDEYIQELNARIDERFGYAATRQFQEGEDPFVGIETAWGAGGAGMLDIDTDEEDVQFIFG